MAATLVLETSAERRVGSSPTWGTKLREWCKGSHRRLKISRLRACGFDSRLSHQISGVSIMDNTVGFYPSDGSSILSRRTKLIKHSNLCESGVTVATGDLKSPVLGRAGSIPASRTKYGHLA